MAIISPTSIEVKRRGHNSNSKIDKDDERTQQADARPPKDNDNAIDSIVKRRDSILLTCISRFFFSSTFCFFGAYLFCLFFASIDHWRFYANLSIEFQNRRQTHWVDGSPVSSYLRVSDLVSAKDKLAKLNVHSNGCMKALLLPVTGDVARQSTVPGFCVS